VTPIRVPIGCLFTPRDVCATPMPQDMTDCDWLKAESKPVSEHTQAFYDSSFKSLFGHLFDSLLKDERLE